MYQRILVATDGSTLSKKAVASAIELAQQAQREGVRSLRDSGMLKVAAGETTLEEVVAATHE